MELKLRDYQREALEAILKNKKGIVVLPTGAGKTIIGVALIKCLQKRYDEVEYYILVPTRALIDQWYAVLSKYKVPLTLGHVMTYASFISLAERSPTSIFGKITIEKSLLSATKPVSRTTLIIVDEAHHSHLDTKLWSAVLLANPEYLVGFTATPNPYKQYAIPVIYRRSLLELSEYIAELNIHKISVALEDKDRDQFLAYTQELAEIRRQIGTALKRGDMEKVEQLRLAEDSLLSIIPFTIAMDNNILNTTVDLASALYNETGERMLIRTMRIAAATVISEMIKKKAGIPGDKILVYRGKEDIDKLFHQNWKILISVKALSEGIDIPDLSLAILSSYEYGNLIGLIQTIGRTLRRTPTKERADVYILVPNLHKYEVAYERLMRYIRTGEQR